MFWADSKLLLFLGAFFQRESKWFKVFARSRVQLIKDNLKTELLKYNTTNYNPLDTTRCKMTRWFNGLSLFWKQQSEWTIEEITSDDNRNDWEVKC